MKKLLIASCIAFAATPVLAESTTASIQDYYKTITRQTPHSQNVCSTVDVPIYGRTSGGASAGDVLGGMIIGGLVGKGATGKDDGAAAGAVIGGMIAADQNRGQQTIIGYRQETQCRVETTYSTQSEEVYNYSTITFNDNGKRYVIRFQK